MDKLIDDIVKAIDYDTWKQGYNLETAEEPEFVEDNRNEIRLLIADYAAKIYQEGYDDGFDLAGGHL